MKVEEASASYVVLRATDTVDWSETTLGEVADFEMGQAPPGSECNKEGNGTVFVKAGEFGSLYPIEVEWTTKPLKFGKKGDVFICVVGATAGKLNLGIDCAIGRSVAAIRPKEGIDTKFIYYQLQPWVLKLRASSSGSAQGVISKAQLSEVPLLVAPLDQQKRIVAEIEKQFSRLDEAVANLKRVKANLKRYKAAVLKAAVEGRLVETEAERARREGRSYETGAQLLQRILETRRSQWQGKGKYKEPAAPDTTDLPELPEGWVWATADQLTDENRAITYGVIKLGGPVDGGVPVLRSSDVRQLRIDLDDVKRISPEIAENYRRTFLKGGEVVMTVRGTLGGIAVVPPQCNGFNVSREVAMLALVDSQMAQLVALFVASAPLENWLMRRTKGIAYTGINIETLKALPIPVPPIAEHKRMVAEVERRLSILRETEAQVDANLLRAVHLRQSVLSRAFIVPAVTD